MDLNSVTVELRPRGEWEAAELGGLMVRRDAAAIYRVWFTITLPAIAVVLLITWFTRWGWLAILLYWWFEPLTDGTILRIVSRRLFGEKANVADTLRAFFQTAWRNKLFWLTPYRLHFARSAMLPITQLEGLTGKRRRERAKTVGSRTFSHGFGVTAVYQHLALAVYVGTVFLVYFLLPESLRESRGGDWLSLFWETDGKWSQIISTVCFYIAQSALHPWFVGAGFGLYINCRTQLEAWDLEVAFRRMMQRRRHIASGATGCLIVLLGVVTAAQPDVAQADEGAPEISEEADDVEPGIAGYWDDQQVTEAMQRVYENDNLDVWREVDDWQRIDQPLAQNRETDGAFHEFIALVITVLSVVVEFGLWIVAGLVLLAVFLSRRRWLPYLMSGTNTKTATHRVMLAGGEVVLDDLPSDVPGETLRLWHAGQHREALALLYRGSVYALVAQHGIRLPRSATENMCVQAVERDAEQNQSLLFRRIVQAWVQCAYASRLIDGEAIADLCRDWPQQYGIQR